MTDYTPGEKVYIAEIVSWGERLSTTIRTARFMRDTESGHVEVESLDRIITVQKQEVFKTLADAAIAVKLFGTP